MREEVFREVMHRGIELGALDVIQFDIDELVYDDLLHAADKPTASEAAWQLERYLFESG